MSARLEDGCISLWEALGRVRDHRRREGQRYPLAGLLLIAVAALLAGRRDQLGIVRWGRQLNEQALASLGITRGRVPAPGPRRVCRRPVFLSHAAMAGSSIWA